MRFWRKDWQSLQTFWNKCDGTATDVRRAMASIDWRRRRKSVKHGNGNRKQRTEIQSKGNAGE